MSQEYVELAGKWNEAVRRGDWEAYAERLDPDVLVRTDPSWPEQRIYGREAVVDWVRSAWESLGPDIQIEGIEDLGDRLLVRLRWHTRGQHSGIEADLCYSELVTIRNGRAVFVEFFLEHEQALKAVGLAE